MKTISFFLLYLMMTLSLVVSTLNSSVSAELFILSDFNLVSTSDSAMTYVPDDNFEQALIDLGYDSGPLNDSVPTDKIKEITSLDVSHKEIFDLTGIEDFAGLQILNCNYNKLSFLDLSQNTFLIELSCYGNELTSLNISQNTGLLYLACFMNQLSNLDISNNPALKDLRCFMNQLSSLDVSSNTALTLLHCGMQPLKSLDISSNIALENLQCQDCELTSLDVSNNKALTDLFCYSNKLTFESLEPAIDIETFHYIPQDSLGARIDTVALTKTDFSYVLETDGTANQYKWYKDGVALPAQISDTLKLNNLSNDDAGAYTCEVTNTIITELTLTSRPLNLSIKESTPLQQDSLALVALYNSTDGQNWTINNNWLTSPVNEWFGVIVGNGRVVEIELNMNNLNGTLPAEIGSLTALINLELAANNLQDSIPAEIGNLTNLVLLALEENSLSGSIPPEITNLNKLQNLEISYNQFNGNIPDELGNLTNLHELRLNHNEFTGSIPVNIKNLTSLRSFYVGNNLLEGIIPQELCDLPYLNYMDFSNNNFNVESCPAIQCLKGKGVYFEDSDQLQVNGISLLNDCADSTVNILQTDSLALVALYNATDGPNWTNNENWLSGPVSSWYGVTIENERVVKLRLQGQGSNDLFGLKGEIPEEIGDLTQLRSLELGWNQLTGLIPIELKKLNNLLVLILIENEFTGEIPQGILQLDSIQNLNLEANNFNGSIPLEICDMKSLQELHLGHNQLDGEIPTQIANLTNLKGLSLMNNRLTGVIPSEIGQLIHLEWLGLSMNRLTGSIPSEIGQLTKLTTLHIWSTEISGQIPIEIGQLTKLELLWLHYNQLSGEVPFEIEGLTNLKYLYLNNNNFEGEIPDICELPLQYINFSNNDFDSQSCPTIHCLKENGVQFGDSVQLQQNGFSLLNDCAAPDTGLVLYLSADSGFVDLSLKNQPINNSGVNIVDAQWGGKAFNFDGSSFLEIADVDNSLDFSGDFTVEMLLNVLVDQQATFFCKCDESSFNPKNFTLEWGEFGYGGGFGWGVDGMTETHGGKFIRQWQKMVFIKKGDSLTYYYGDRILRKNVTNGIDSVFSNNLNDDPLFIGKGVSSAMKYYRPPYFLIGQMDEIKVYKRALELSEIDPFYLEQPIPPIQPFDFTTAVPGNSEVTLHLQNYYGEDISSVNIYRGNEYRAANLIATISPNDTIFIDSEVTNGVSYFYRKTVVDTAGLESGYANEAWTTPTETPTIGHWTFDNLSGDMVPDISGYDQNGVIYGGATTIEGINGDALVLDGIDDYVEIPVAVPLNNVGGQLTAEAIVNISDFADDSWIFGRNINWFLSFDLEAIIRYAAYFYNQFEVPTQAGLNEWHHLAMTYDGAKIRVYLDYEEIGSKTVEYNKFKINDAPLLLGLEATTQQGHFHGLIDEVRVSNLALSPDEFIHINEIDCPQHFQTVWEGTSGVDHMNINVFDAKLDGLDLEPGDEVGVFDGEVCVGYGKVSQTIDSQNLLSIVVSRDDGSGNGYTPGDEITYKFWDCSESIEYIVNDVQCFDNQLNAVSCSPFEAGGTAYVSLSVNSEVCINLHFNTGWNIFASQNHPESPDMLNVFQPLVDNGSLIKIQDETGKSVENMGVFGGWTNYIGDISPAEGYKIKVAITDSLNVCGAPVDYPFAIPLNNGWNIMGYAQTSDVDGMDIVQQLVDNGTLVKVQDETGRSIEDMGVFGGWTNYIGSFLPGEGYKIKVSGADTLWLYESYPKSTAIPLQFAETKHFIPEFEGNGVDHMNINLVELPQNIIQPGDEVGVFDGEICVGATTLLTHHFSSGTIPLIASATDMEGMRGFAEGNKYTIKLWKAKQSQEFGLEPEWVKGPTAFTKHESAILSLNKYATTGLEGFTDIANNEVRVYPNPFSEEVTVELTLAEDSQVEVEVLNQLGQRIKYLTNKKLLTKGSHNFTWDGMNNNNGQVSPGIYQLKMEIGNRVFNRKIILSK